jgi:hypothetical protein
MDEILATLTEIRTKIVGANRMTEQDASVSPVLAAVVAEFAKKADKAVGFARDGKGFEAVIELEQAGDSAKAAAEADTSAAEGTRQAVLDAHLAICMYKAGLDT